MRRYLRMLVTIIFFKITSTKAAMSIRWSKKELQTLKRQTVKLNTGKRINQGVWHIAAFQVATACGIRRTAKACENMFYRTCLDKRSDRWSIEDTTKLQFLVTKQHSAIFAGIMHKLDWNAIAKCFKNRTPHACKQKFYESVR